MGSDAAMANASAPSVPRDVGKKKKVNRSAKLKHAKLDARREQWLSQVKSKDCKMVNDRPISPSPTSPPLSLCCNDKGSGSRGDDLKNRSREEENDGSGLFLQDGDFDMPLSSPASSASGTNSSSKDCPDNSISSRSSFCGSSSRSISDADEDEGTEEDEHAEEGDLDDWEAVADALTSTKDTHSTRSEVNCCPIKDTFTPAEFQGNCGGRGILKTPDISRQIPKAWRPDDVFRPQSLPTISKQHSFPPNMERHHSHGNMGWVGIVSQPSSCPICFEDLDLTDSSFLPCSCGFHLCLFCHKRILEDDGRCPGCRKEYSPLPGGETLVNGGGGATPLPPFLSYSRSMGRC